MKLKILHLEDNGDDVELVRRSLGRQGLECEIHAVSSEPDYVSALERKDFDVILSDSGLPGYDGSAALAAAHERCPGVPFIVVSGSVQLAPAEKASPPNVTAHISKNDMTQLGAIIQHSLQKPQPQLMVPMKHYTELEERVKELTRQLELAKRELEAFSYSVAHNLRSPLIAIDGFCHILLENGEHAFDEENREYLTRIGTAVTRMHRMIEDLLNLSKVSLAPMHHGPVDLSSMAREIMWNLRERAPERLTDFVIAEGLTAEGDPDLLRIVLENLLANAWKYTSRRPSAHIELGICDVQGEQVFFVQDNGAGFDSRFAEKLFKPFSRLHTQAEFPGNGIGLALSERVIHRHGGKLWAESKAGCGATFYFTIPAQLK